MMRAIVINQFGGYEVFEEMKIAKPVVKPGHVLIKVLASSLNPIETKIRSGLVPAITPAFPAILNSDFSGVIVETGTETDPWQAGDEVFGCAGGVGALPGALADYILADIRLIARKPVNIDHATAALFPLVSITAWEAIIEKARVQEGDKVLIHGIAGGVGHLALQLAKDKGACVFGTVSREQQAAVARDLGADQIIYYKQETVEKYTEKYTQGHGFDVVFDPVGGSNLITSFQAVKKNGIVCTTNARVSLDLGIMHAKAISLQAVFMLIPMLYNLERERHGRILKNVGELIQANKLKVHKAARQFRFSEIGKAHEYIESGQAIGKVSLIQD